jgi:ribosomal protein L25 (general stress protein Ctc)
MFNQVLHEKNDEIIRLKQLLEERYGPDHDGLSRRLRIADDCMRDVVAENNRLQKELKAAQEQLKEALNRNERHIWENGLLKGKLEAERRTVVAQKEQMESKAAAAKARWEQREEEKKKKKEEKKEKR